MQIAFFFHIFNILTLDKSYEEDSAVMGFD